MSSKQASEGLLTFTARGANLAAVLAQRAAMYRPPIRLLAQVLLMPILNLTPTYDPETWSPSMREHAQVFGLWALDVVWSRDMHTPNVEDRSHTDASPLFQESEQAFGNMAPAWIGVAELDVLRNDGEFYANKLQQRGVPVELKTYHGELVRRIIVLIRLKYHIPGATHLTAQADGVSEV
jgi:acetyl esterase/lipase